MTPTVLVELGFQKIMNESYAQTQTGAEVLRKYQTYLMANAESCGVVNQFVREANQCRYDSGINEALSIVAEYIAQNKTLWAIASACESINANGSRTNMLNRNAAAQASKLLEMNEEDAVKYIRSGALKNVMFCEAFRNIAKQVFAGQQIIECTADYTRVTPVSMVESVGDGHCFVVAGKLYKQDDANNIVEGEWNEVSNTFRVVESLLESNLVEIDEENIIVNYNGAKYTINEAGKVAKESKGEAQTFTTEQFRDHSRMVVMASNPRFKNQVAGVLEAIALTAENFDSVMTMDKAGIYTTKNDKFVVIEAGNNLYAASLASRRHQPWSINEDAVKAIAFIKKQTNADLSEAYAEAIANVVEQAEQENAQSIKEQLENDKILSLKERIDLLTEKFKGDPAKLAVLSKLASEMATL